MIYVIVTSESEVNLMKKAIVTTLAAMLLSSLIPAAEARDGWHHGRFVGYPYGYYSHNYHRSNVGRQIGWGLAGLGIGLGLGALAGSRDRVIYTEPAPLYTNEYVYPSGYSASYGDSYWY